MSIRVLLVDDHVMFREALAQMLNQDPSIQVIGELGDGVGILEAVAQLQPDVVVMDISMPNVNGIEATRRLVTLHPKAKVVALSGFNYKQFVVEVLDAGASGYVVKTAAAQQLIQAIGSVAAGHTYLCSEATEMLVRSNRRAGQSALSASENKRLGQRETAVLKLLARGKSSPQIGTELHIATSTVDVHRRNIMRKLDLHSVAELTKYAIRNGFIDL
ncbi:MAG: response regulator transcription factor [Rhodoferax sp.]|nr:response regulator transcription factor [Rhodoferax sp.]